MLFQQSGDWLALATDTAFVARRHVPHEIGFLQIYTDLQRAGALLPAVLCALAPLELQDFCGEGDAAR
jgi:hypothetical protein